MSLTNWWICGLKLYPNRQKKMYLDICDTYMSKYLNRNFIIYQVLFTQIQREKMSRRDFKRKREKRRGVETDKYSKGKK